MNLIPKEKYEKYLYTYREHSLMYYNPIVSAKQYKCIKIGYVEPETFCRSLDFMPFYTKSEDIPALYFEGCNCFWLFDSTEDREEAYLNIKLLLEIDNEKLYLT